MHFYKISFGILWSLCLLVWGALSCLPDGKKFVTYTINNQIQDPKFNESMELGFVAKKNLLYYMEQSVLTNPAEFTGFSATFSSPYGYFIGSINGLAGNWEANKTWWQISNQDGPLEVGVVSYIPKAGDSILFNFTMG